MSCSSIPKKRLSALILQILPNFLRNGRAAVPLFQLKNPGDFQAAQIVLCLLKCSLHDLTVHGLSLQHMLLLLIDAKAFGKIPGKIRLALFALGNNILQALQ